MGTRVVLIGAVVAALALTGCGQAASHAAAGGRRALYEVSIANRGGDSPLGGTAAGWLDPADGRYRLTGRQPADHGMPAMSTTDVGGPGVDESTTSFSGMPAPQTTLTYGSAVDAGISFEPAMDALREHLGLPVAQRIRYTVAHVGGRVRLTIPWSEVARAMVRRLGAPAGLPRSLSRAARRGGMVVTILRTVARTHATVQRLFSIDPAKADEIVRTLPAGVVPVAPRPAYWLGRTYGGRAAQPATSGIATRRGGAAAQANYEISYARPGADGSQLSIDTVELPRGAAVTHGLAWAFGGHPVPIRLADGTPATFVYQRFTGHGGAGVQELGASSGKLPPAKDIPPAVFVFAGREQIVISPQGPLPRAQAVALAEALRPI